MASDDEDSDSSQSSVYYSSVPPEPLGGVGYVLSFRIEGRLRRILVLILMGGNFASLNGAVLFFILGWYVRNSLQKQMAFLQDFYSPAAVPSALTAAGFIVLAAALIGMKAGVDALMLTPANPDACRGAAKTLAVFWACAGVASLAILVAACTCFVEVRALRDGMDKGLRAAMGRYGNGSVDKVEIDRLQLEYQCCGVRGFEDWYEVAWIDAKYLDLKSDSEMKTQMKSGKYQGQDVPFSCCRLDLVRPCVSVRVQDTKYHSKYSFPQDVTLNKDGCREKVTDSLGRTMFRGVGGFVFVCFLIWIAMTVIGRYLHTSIDQMASGQRPVGWLVPFGDKNKTQTAMKVKQDDVNDSD